jgi:hypothetical protein
MHGLVELRVFSAFYIIYGLVELSWQQCRIQALSLFFVSHLVNFDEGDCLKFLR